MPVGHFRPVNCLMPESSLQRSHARGPKTFVGEPDRLGPNGVVSCCLRVQVGKATCRVCFSDKTETGL